MSKDDLDLKIGTKEESAWTAIKDQAQEEIDRNLRINRLNKVLIKEAEKAIKEEQKKG